MHHIVRFQYEGFVLLVSRSVAGFPYHHVVCPFHSSTDPFLLSRHSTFFAEQQHLAPSSCTFVAGLDAVNKIILIKQSTGFVFKSELMLTSVRFIQRSGHVLLHQRTKDLFLKSGFAPVNQNELKLLCKKFPSINAAQVFTLQY